MRQKWNLKREIDTFLGKMRSIEDTQRDDGHKIGENVAKSVQKVANGHVSSLNVAKRMLKLENQVLC